MSFTYLALNYCSVDLGRGPDVDGTGPLTDGF